jgi:DNA-binding CsgD family transcriptional regulator
MQRGAELAARCGATFDGGPGAAGGQGSRSRVAPDGSNGAAHRPPRLTMSEVRVSELVLRGLSNQQVADQLCISRRTVDTHLNRIYRKLEIRSRSELGYALKLLG